MGRNYVVLLPFGYSLPTPAFSLRISETSSFQHGNCPTYTTFNSMSVQELTRVRAVILWGSLALTDKY